MSLSSDPQSIYTDGIYTSIEKKCETCLQQNGKRKSVKKKGGIMICPTSVPSDQIQRPNSLHMPTQNEQRRDTKKGVLLWTLA